MTDKIISWSFSRYGDYKQCPLKAKLKYICKLAEPANPAMERGTSIHKLAEDYITGEISELPVELSRFASEFNDLKILRANHPDNVVVEEPIALTRDWKLTTWDNWTDCWLRAKIDCAHYTAPNLLILTDWKTGKFTTSQNLEYAEQLELYALAALVRYPHVDEVRPRLVYLDAGVIYPSAPLIYTRADLTQLKACWAAKVEPMFADTIFAPRPTHKCKWCHFRKSNGGPCKF